MNRVLYREWYPADHVQPSPDRTDRHGDVLAAVPRSVQLRLRPAGREHARSGRLGDARALRRRGQARRDHALRLELLHLVERRPADDGLLPQSGRPAHRVDRQPHARTDRLRPGSPAAQGRPAVADRAADVALPPVDRLLPHRQLRGARLRAALPRNAALQHLSDGAQRHPPRQHRHLDRLSQAHRGGESRDRQGHEDRVDRPAHGRRRTRPGGAVEILPAPAQARVARRARLRAAGGQGGLPHRHQVRQCADQGRRHRASRHGVVLGRRRAVSRRIVRGQDGAGVPAARHRHVRTAGSSERLPVSRRTADPAVRQRRVDAGVPDGRGLRPRARGRRRAVRSAARTS